MVINFCLSEKSLSLFHFWRTVFLNMVFLIGCFFLSALWIYHLTLFWTIKFLPAHLLIVLWGLYMTFENLTITCLMWIILGSSYLVTFGLLGSGCPFPSSDLWSFLPLFLWINFLVLSLSSPWETYIKHVVPQESVKLSSLFFHSFFFFVSD